ncbi:hypothetical protein EDD15DRAFT_2478459 [Pisolithus albus]|nr:hypothetical protein EDD15DRAFT_2478459 [Pisolithus albus]
MAVDTIFPVQRSFPSDRTTSAPCNGVSRTLSEKDGFADGISSVDEVAIADAVFIFKRGATIGQSVEGGHGLVRGVVGVGLGTDAVEEDTRIAEHMATGAGINESVVRNGAGLPVLSGFNSLLDDSIDLVSRSAGRGNDVAEQLVQVSFAKELVERLPLSRGSLLMIVMMCRRARALKPQSARYHAMSREIVAGEKFPLGFLVLQGIVTLQLEVFEFGDEISLRSDATVSSLPKAALGA